LEVETNDYVWTCDYAKQPLTDIISEFYAKFNVPESLNSHVMLAIRAIPTLDLTSYLKNFISDQWELDAEANTSHFANSTYNKINKAILSLIIKRKQRVWKPKNDVTLAMQQL
jgi:hypothetical protein